WELLEARAYQMGKPRNLPQPFRHTVAALSFTRPFRVIMQSWIDRTLTARRLRYAMAGRPYRGPVLPKFKPRFYATLEAYYGLFFSAAWAESAKFPGARMTRRLWKLQRRLRGRDEIFPSHPLPEKFRRKQKEKPLSDEALAPDRSSRHGWLLLVR